MPRVVTDDVQVATIRKNANEEFRITVGTYMGYKMVRLWVWYRDGDGFRPGKSGVAFRAEQLDDIIEALTKARTADVVPFPKSR